MLGRKLSPRFFLSASLVALPVLFVAAEASAQECAGDADCGHGFSCETVVTSVGTGVGGAAGTSGEAQGGAGGYAGTGGTAPLPPVCNNAICQAGETPENCPNDCKYTTLCASGPCTSNSDCAADFYCPPVGSVGTGGGPNVSFCGDLLCAGGTEDQFSCPIDCDPNYRRCTPGYRGCQTNADCAVGYVCTFSGGAGGSGGTGGTGGTGASGAPAGGQSSEPAPATGGTGAGGGIGGTSGTGLGGGAGTGVAGSGTAGVPSGGSSGMPAEGLCMPQGTGGTSACPYCCPPGQIWTGEFCAIDGQPPAGGTTGNGGTGQNGGSGADRNSGDEGETIVTHGGCALSRPNAPSPFALFLFAAAALARFGRRRR
jgi:hypothetical protein